MKIALDATGLPIAAAAGAPARARCPDCKAVVILRSRSRRPGDAVYFWRHQDHVNTDCPARFSTGAKITTIERV
jgi:predicted RNA-binding Zn-ribbon protein involved in translation (DUF1610 family)